MNFDDTPQEAAFRAEASAFLAANATLKSESEPRKEREPELVERARAWQKLKSDNGWACLQWPEEFGGRGASPMELIIWGQEESRYDVPVGPYAIGLGMCGPTMIAYASDEHKAERLPRMSSGVDIWCQLFSEPAAGSDLANLRTRSERDGNDWIINGQKIWTSGAHYSDWGILVTRSDPTVPKHKGLTFFFVDMKSPGIEIRPIKQISGDANFNEVYFADVRIPDDQRLGAVGDGWRVSLTTLMNERLAVGDAGGTDVPELMDLVSKIEIDGKPAIENHAVRHKIANWYCQMSGLRNTKYRVMSALSRGQTPGPENSITKVVSASKMQDIGAFGIDLMDMGGVVVDRKDSNGLGSRLFQASFMLGPGYRVAGGTDEILRNIIAERVLGLPQDVRVDKGIPYNEVAQGSK
ncbi:MAG: acyl-CoA dehydrogenase family protein [Gammaproteobacteria bacterium]|jgi:alkylation response protein AidB-like acyl-CoA dehydrogenase|nr:acyl-CoA dehydrogenase family protein [Gammaproteobacteria bacterium]